MFKVGGKAVVRVPDNVLFEGGRERLFEKNWRNAMLCILLAVLSEVLAWLYVDWLLSVFFDNKIEALECYCRFIELGEG